MRTSARAPGCARQRRALALVAGLAGVLGGGSSPAVAAAVSYRVVGGSSVPAITSFPFQVALFIHTPGGLLNQSGGLAFCGGVIVDPTQILTAAHCVTNPVTGQPMVPSTVTVFAGNSTLPLIAPSGPSASAIAVNPHYNVNTADYDVAVVTLPAPLYAGTPRADGTSPVAPIALITPALADRFANPDLIPAEPVVVSGWGETGAVAVGSHDTNQSLPFQLQAARTHLVPDATCADEYSRLGSIGVPSITPRMLCAGEPAGGVDACAGDSGGPLVVDLNAPASPPGDYVLAGLIDFGAGCAQPGYPGVYVRMAVPDIASFVAQQAQGAGQQLLTAPVPVGVTPPRHRLGSGGAASLAGSTARVRGRLTHVPVRCATATCTGSLTLRTTTTVGRAHFSIAADTTRKVAVRITPSGQRQLDRHGHRLRTRATLRATGAASTVGPFTITD